MAKTYYVYILTNANCTVLYTGITSNLKLRVREHKNKTFPGFTSKYNVDRLVYAEAFSSAEAAICREKQIKNYSRARKVALIEEKNRGWAELWP